MERQEIIDELRQMSESYARAYSGERIEYDTSKESLLYHSNLIDDAADLLSLDGEVSVRSKAPRPFPTDTTKPSTMKR
jgi:hypothetical protein